MVDIVSGYTLFVMSQYDIIFKIANQRCGDVRCEFHAII